MRALPRHATHTLKLTDLASGIGSASGDGSATDDEVTIGQRVVDKVVTVEVVEIWGQDSISGGLREAGV